MSQGNLTERQKESRKWFRLMFVGIVVFGVIVALGTYLTDTTPDWRKPIVVLGGTGLFLGMWTLALKNRKVRS